MRDQPGFAAAHELQEPPGFGRSRRQPNRRRKRCPWAFKHAVIEKNSIILLTVLTLLVVSVGGLVEIAPLFYLESPPSKR